MGETVATRDTSRSVASRHAGELYLSGGACHLLHHEWALMGIADIRVGLRALGGLSPCRDAARLTITGDCNEWWCYGSASGVSGVLRRGKEATEPQARS